MNLKVQFELPLPEGFSPYLELIAKTHGYVGQPGAEMYEFVCREICEKQISGLFRYLVKSALEAQLGLMGGVQISTVEQTFDATHTVKAEIVG